MWLKVGELAKKTGLTIRTLHHYDEIGLLAPSTRSDAGYRLYGKDDIVRLHRIQAFKQLGFSLADIGNLLTGDGGTLPDLIAQQLAALDRQVAQAQALRAQLLRMQTQLDRGVEPKLADLLTTLEAMTMYEKYFNAEQMQALTAHQLAAKEDVAVHWPALVAAVRANMDRGVPPEHPDTQTLVAQWLKMVDKLVGGDQSLLIKLDEMTRKEPAVQAESGIDAAMLHYIGAAMTIQRAALYAGYLEPRQIQHIVDNRALNAQQWPPLVAAMRTQMEQGAKPGDEQVQTLARRWQALFEASFSGGDPTVRDKLKQAVTEQPSLLRGTGIDPILLAFVRSAIQALPAA